MRGLEMLLALAAWLSFFYVLLFPRVEDIVPRALLCMCLTGVWYWVMSRGVPR